MAIKYDSNFTEGDLLSSSVVNNIIDSIKENATNVEKKMDKVEGKVLSTNDYTNEEKQKVADNSTKINNLNENKVDKSDLDNYVKFTDYASEDKAGVVRIESTPHACGLKISNGLLSVSDVAEFHAPREGFNVITFSQLNNAVKSALSDSMYRIIDMTSNEQILARSTLGIEQDYYDSLLGESELEIGFPSNNKRVLIADTALTKISISMIGSNNPTPGYEETIIFTSGDTATTISVPDEFTFVGVDCDKDGAFIPSKNTNYEVHIQNISPTKESYKFVGRVGVY